MRKTETVTVEVTREQAVEITCDFCGQVCPPLGEPINGRQYFDVSDGFEFKYRLGEEDVIWLRAEDMCDECHHWDEEKSQEISTKILAAVKLLHEAAPFARVYAPIWGEEMLGFPLVDNDTINE